MAAAANSKASVASDDESTIKVAPKKDAKEKASGTIKLKKPAPKHSKPGNWRDGSVIDDDKKVKATESPATETTSPGPVVNQLDDTAREAFPTGRPLEDAPELQVCKHCKKSVLKTAFKNHLTSCLKVKKEKAQRKKEQKEARDRERKEANGKDDKDDDGDTKMDDDDDEEGASPEKKGPGGGLKSAKKSAGKKVEVEKGKKRKADADAEKGPKPKKKKEEPKPKAAKPKGPVDVERQCGVMKDGVPCARSLTCKSHSMGAKRAVAGRSLPYDMLLTAYQKKNQAKQQKAAIDANAPLEDEEATNGPIDSDDELAQVTHGLSHWNPQPLVTPVILEPIRMRYDRERLYDQLFAATNGWKTNIFKVTSFGGTNRSTPAHVNLKENINGTVVEDVDADGEMDIDGGDYTVMSADMLAASRRAAARRATGIVGEFDTD